MSGWKVGDRFLLKMKDSGRYRTEWFEITRVGPRTPASANHLVEAIQAGSLAQRFDAESLDKHAIPFDDAIVNLEQGLGGSTQYTPQYEEAPLKRPFSELEEGDLVEVDPDKSSFADHLFRRTGSTVFPLEAKDNSHMPVRLDGMWVEREAVIGVDFDA